MNFTAKKKLEGMEQALIEAGRTEALLRMRLAAVETRQSTYASCNDKFVTANERLVTANERLTRSNKILTNRNAILEKRCSEAEMGLATEITRKCANECAAKHGAELASQLSTVEASLKIANDIIKHYQHTFEQAGVSNVQELMEKYNSVSEELATLSKHHAHMGKCHRQAVILLRQGQAQDMSAMSLSQVMEIVRPLRGVRKALYKAFGNPNTITLEDILKNPYSTLTGRKYIGKATIAYIQKCADYSGITWGRQ